MKKLILLSLILLFPVMSVSTLPQELGMIESSVVGVLPDSGKAITGRVVVRIVEGNGNFDNAQSYEQAIALAMKMNGLDPNDFDYFVEFPDFEKAYGSSAQAKVAVMVHAILHDLQIDDSTIISAGVDGFGNLMPAAGVVLKLKYDKDRFIVASREEIVYERYGDSFISKKIDIVEYGEAMGKDVIVIETLKDLLSSNKVFK